jgi:hypothetical protein
MPTLPTLSHLERRYWTDYGARIGQYWLDPVANELTRLGLIRIQHLPDHHAPVAVLTPAGLDRLSDLGHDVPPNMADHGLALKAATGSLAPPVGMTYVTAWLDQEVEPEAPAPVGPTPAAAPVGDADHWSRDAATVEADKALLEEARQALEDRAVTRAQARAILDRLGVTGPFTEDGDAGIVANIDGNAASLAFVDIDRELPPERARAIALLIAWACRIAFSEFDA